MAKRFGLILGRKKAGEMPQLLKWYSYKPVDMSSIPRTHIENVKHGHTLGVLVLKAETNGSLGLAD